MAENGLDNQSERDEAGGVQHPSSSSNPAAASPDAAVTAAVVERLHEEVGNTRLKVNMWVYQCTNMMIFPRMGR